MTGNDNIVKAILTDANAYADAVSVEAHKNAEKLSVEAKAYRDETVRAAKAGGGGQAVSESEKAK